MSLFAKVKSSPTFKKNSYKIGDKYYYASSALDSADLLEISGYLSGIVKKDNTKFKVSYEQIKSIFNGDETKTNEFIFALTQVTQTTGVPVFNVIEDSGTIYVEVVGNLDNVIYDVYGVSAAYGFAAIGIEFL